jgi:hypothetical protein
MDSPECKPSLDWEVVPHHDSDVSEYPMSLEVGDDVSGVDEVESPSIPRKLIEGHPFAD